MRRTSTIAAIAAFLGFAPASWANPTGPQSDTASHAHALAALPALTPASSVAPSQEDEAPQAMDADEARALMVRQGCLQLVGNPERNEDAAAAQTQQNLLTGCESAMRKGLHWTDEAFAACTSDIGFDKANACIAAISTFLLRHDDDTQVQGNPTESAAALMRDVCSPSTLCGSEP